MAVDPGFIHGVRRHVEEDGRAVRTLAEVGDPALWGPQLAGQWTPDRLREARERSLAQARELLLEAVEGREALAKAEADWVESVLRGMGQKAADFDLDQLCAFITLDRDRCEAALDRLEEEDRVRAGYSGRDRPHWSLVLD